MNNVKQVCPVIFIAIFDLVSFGMRLMIFEKQSQASSIVLHDTRDCFCRRIVTEDGKLDKEQFVS